jgi:hypothetical protein
LFQRAFADASKNGNSAKTGSHDSPKARSLFETSVSNRLDNRPNKQGFNEGLPPVILLCQADGLLARLLVSEQVNCTTAKRT